MTDVVPSADIERIVGVQRHRKAHYGRASSAEQVVYILHSKECLDSGIDLRDCRFSVALDRGINERRWTGYEDVPVALGVWNDDLVPLKGTEIRTDRPMTDTTLSLAARLAANLIVDAIKLAKPGARLAGKIGDRLLGGSPFNEAEAQRFLTMGGADRLAEAEVEREVYEPDPLWQAARVRELDDAHEFNTMPNWPQSCKPDPKPPGYWLNAIENTIKDHADFLAPQSSAPVAHSPEPVVVDESPDAVAPPGTASGHLSQCSCPCIHCSNGAHWLCHGEGVEIDTQQHVPDPEQPVGVGVSPGTGGTRHGPVGDLADELCDAVLDSYDHAPMVGGSQLDLPLRDEFLEGFDWESAARILLTYFSVTRK